MVKHIVMFKLKKCTNENRKILLTALNGLKEKIDLIRSLETGVNFTDSERAFDIVLATAFDSREALAAYARHAHHLPVSDLVRKMCSVTHVVDYDLN